MAKVAQLSLGLLCAAIVAQACGSSDDKKKASPPVSPSAGQGQGGDAEGGTGAVSPGGKAGSSNVTPSEGGGGAGSEPVTPAEGGGGAGNEPVTPAEGGAAGEASIDMNGGAGGEGPVAVDLTSCDAAGEACCAGAQCDTTLACAGTNCTCVGATQGNLVTRVDGLLLRSNQGMQTPIKSSASGDVLANVTSAWQGHTNGCASLKDGSAWCWTTDPAGNSSGSLGTGTGSPNVATNTGFRVQVAPGNLAPPVYLSDVKAFSEGFSGYIATGQCAVTNAGAIYCWGPKTDGNLMQTGKDEPYATPIKADATTPITNAISVAVGSRHACYLTQGKEVWCWGANIGGPLGNGSETWSAYPTRAGALSNVSKVVAGPDYTCALVDSGADAGRVFCWGHNNPGIIGIGAPSANTDGCINYCKTSPARVRTDLNTYLEGVVDIAAGYQTMCALKADRSLWCWGSGGGYGNFAAAAQAPGTTPVTNVAALSVFGNEVRVVEPNGVYYRVDKGVALTALDVNCGLLN